MLGEVSSNFGTVVGQALAQRACYTRLNKGMRSLRVYRGGRFAVVRRCVSWHVVLGSAAGWPRQSAAPVGWCVILLA